MGQPVKPPTTAEVLDDEMPPGDVAHDEDADEVVEFSTRSNTQTGSPSTFGGFPFSFTTSRTVMPVLFRDIETRSARSDLADCRRMALRRRYRRRKSCASPMRSTTARCDLDTRPAHTRRNSSPRPPIRIGWSLLITPISRTAIETRLLHPRFDWPLVPIERHRCTLAAALANALPGSLDAAAAALGLPSARMPTAIGSCCK